MDWTSIIVAVAGLLAAVDLSRFIFPRLFRKEKETEIKGKETEIKGKEKENESVEVDSPQGHRDPGTTAEVSSRDDQ